MTTPLTPALALEVLRELSTDVRAAAVLDAAGAPLAGDRSLARRAHALLEAAQAPAGAATGDGARLVRDGELLAARCEQGLGIAVLAGEFALFPLLEQDLRIVAEALIPRHD